MKEIRMDPADYGILSSAGLLPPAAAADKGAPLVAVLPFDDGSIEDRWWGDHWDVGQGIADMMITELLAQKKFRLVEREMIDKIIQEQDFGAGRRMDIGSAAEIGKILGVRYVIIGRVTEFTIDTKGGAIGGPASGGSLDHGQCPCRGRPAPEYSGGTRSTSSERVGSTPSAAWSGNRSTPPP